MIDLKTAEAKSLESAYRAQIVDIGRIFYDKNWSLATSSNYSVVLDKEPLRLLITASGKDKGKLTTSDFVTVSSSGKLIAGENQDATLKPSAETMLHVMLGSKAGVGAVLHSHSVPATVLSQQHRQYGYIEIEGLEMLKAISGITTHEARIRVPIFSNTQDIDSLARDVEERYNELPKAFLVSGHGLYTWGADLSEAKRHVEGLEFLFEVLLKSRG
jgi:methylthioribulose-1-phosphate dehydratase